MTSMRLLAAIASAQYRAPVRTLLHLLVLISVALLPFTSLAARLGTASDLPSSAIEFEQASVPSPGRSAPVTQQHRHCTLWAAEATNRPGDPHTLINGAQSCPVWSDVLGTAIASPQAPSPPPKV